MSRRAIPAWLAVCAAATLAGLATASPPIGEAEVLRGLAYLPADRAEKADLYLPVDAGTALRPAVVVIHGGGWISEARDSNREENIARALAERGIASLSIDYLLGNEEGTRVCWPQNLHDCKTAVRWLRRHARQYRLDPDRIGAIGGSAGGHLAAMLAVTGPECGLDPAAPFGDLSCRIQGAIDMYGPADLENWRDVQALCATRSEAPELYKAFSVLTYVSSDDPPILMIQGDLDGVTPVSQSEALAARLAAHGVEHRLEIVQGAGHSFDLQPDQRDLRPLAAEFFHQRLRPPANR
jgi:acetyl esterase/lipase